MDFKCLLDFIHLYFLFLFLLLLLLPQHELSDLLFLEYDAEPAISSHRLVSFFVTSARLDPQRGHVDLARFESGRLIVHDRALIHHTEHVQIGIDWAILAIDQCAGVVTTLASEHLPLRFGASKVFTAAENASIHGRWIQSCLVLGYVPQVCA